MTFDLSFLSLINETTEDFDKRVVGRNKIKGFTVSTVMTTDEGYETAIGDARGMHPTERYVNKKLAIVGHKKWVKLIDNGKRKIKRLGWSDMSWMNKEVNLEATHG